MAGRSDKTSQQTSGSTATVTAPKTTPARPRPRMLPPWKVLLHNDDVNDMAYVVETIRMLTPLAEHEAIERMLDAHQRGITLLLTTHRERAELYREQFASRRLTVTVEQQ